MSDSLKDEFKAWMSELKKTTGEAYSEKTIQNYTSAITNTTNKFKNLKIKYTDLFNYNDSAELQKVYNKIQSRPDFIEVDNNSSNRSFSNGMKMYLNFLTEQKNKQNIRAKDTQSNSQMIEEVEITQMESSEVESQSKDTGRYWWLNANPKYWSFSEINIGEEVEWSLYNENGHKRRIFNNLVAAKEGDLIIGYESSPVKQIVALGRVSVENDGESLWIEKTENLVGPIDFSDIRELEELENMEVFVNPQGSFFKLRKEEYDILMDIIRERNPMSKAIVFPVYEKEDFLEEVYMTSEEYDTLVSLLLRKMNVILQGAPGVGKTFAAKRLAYSIMGCMNDDHILNVQFHQSYSYEDFIMGYKPCENGFKLETGIFYNFCKTAENSPDEPHFVIIDEINRGNLSKIFGELLMLIENDKRGQKLFLAYNHMNFHVPDNLYIIGMMNTADRSLAMIDYALRRRFSFYRIKPAFEKDGFIEYLDELDDPKLYNLINVIEELNKVIIEDASLGEGFVIGHSYFCGQEESTDDWLEEIVEYDLIPILEEYWFDDINKVKTWSNKMRGALNDER